MKYYSEITNTVFDSVEDLEKAEKRILAEQEAKAKAEKTKAAKKALRKKEVENALKEAEAAQEKAKTLLQDFIHDYGHFHTSYTFENNPSINSLDFLNELSHFLQF